MLPKRERIAKGSEIKRILKTQQLLGRKQFHFSSPLLYFAAEENGKINSRIAVVCSGGLGSAVVRNRARRRILGVFSKIRRKFAKNIDIVIVPKSGVFDSGTIEGEILRGLTRLKLC